MGNFERVANAPAEEIARARDDAKNSLSIALHLYEANRWNYGDGAFGLRLAAWIARKAPDVLIDMRTLLMFRLRQVPNAIRPSDEIAEMAKQARKVWLYSKRHEWLWRNDPRFSKILNPKRIKSAFADEIALKQWQSELNAIIVQVTEKPRWVPMMKVKRSAKVIKLQPPLQCAEPTPADMELEEDDIAWATRSGMWQSRVTRRRRDHQARQGRARINSRGTWRVAARRKRRADHPKWIYALSATARNNPLFPRRRRTARANYFIGRQRQHFL